MAPNSQFVLRTTVRTLLFLIIFSVILFVPAGIHWRGGWRFLAIFVACTILSCLWLWRVNPDIYVARSKLSREGTKSWDRALVAFILVAFFATFFVAGLDARYGWTLAPEWLVVLGYILYGLGFAGSTWVYGVNKFAEPTVRIQSERHQMVISTGPYAIVRHPLYLFSFILMGGAALALGSLAALIPVGCGMVLIVIRTVWEDATLQNELEGYREYAQQVRSRLVPGIW